MKSNYNTRKVYAIESKWQREEWSIKKLRNLSVKIWNNEAPQIWKKFPPKVVAGKGIKYNGKYLSYCLGRSYIELSRNQRDPKVLVHEITHALVGGMVCGHNQTFWNKMVYLLTKYKIRTDIKNGYRIR